MLAHILLLAALFGASSTADAKRAIVVVYDGWGTPSSFTVSGRVLFDKGERAPRSVDAGRLSNLLRHYKAFESDEIKEASVTVKINGHDYGATTDNDGVFVVRASLPARDLPLGKVGVEVVLEATPQHSSASASGLIYTHDDREPFVAVISDIDDTIVKTHVTSKKEMARTVLLKNAKQLEPVEGAPENYKKASGAGVGAFFYLSGSPQNLYLRIQTFLAEHAFPPGPLMLKNVGADPILKQTDYKRARLEMLAEAFPKMRMILVGDSGERDPEIFSEFRGRFPERVLGIVMRAHGEPIDARFAGMTVVEEKYSGTDVISGLLHAPAKR